MCQVLPDTSKMVPKDEHCFRETHAFHKLHFLKWASCQPPNPKATIWPLRGCPVLLRSSPNWPLLYPQKKMVSAEELSDERPLSFKQWSNLWDPFSQPCILYITIGNIWKSYRKSAIANFKILMLFQNNTIQIMPESNDLLKYGHRKHSIITKI